jgi:signal transduction histidine kinase
VVVARGGRAAGMRRWVVSMVAQFAAHAALALHNGWLTEEREAQLETIRGLEHMLRAHNLELEVKVADRTEELRETIQHLEEVDEQRRRLLAHVVQAAEEERRRIANDIHDDPVQKMVVLKMRLELLAKANPGLPDLDDAQEAVLGTIRSMRHLLFDLRPPILDEEGIGPALRYFLDNSEIDAEWSVDDELDTEPSTQTRVILYRIAQEALTNARKHANADEIRVKLEERDGGVWMEISDDGVGYTPEGAVVAQPGHLGVAAMRERAEMAGGWCTLRSLPGAGTTLEVWLPPEDADGHHVSISDEVEAMAVSPLRMDRIA